jgi:hypothetical protein
MLLLMVRGGEDGREEEDGGMRIVLDISLFLSSLLIFLLPLV